MNQLAFSFDTDAVIVHSVPVYLICNKDIFKELAIEVDEDIQLNFIGVTAKRKWTILKEQFSLSSPNLENTNSLVN